MSDEGRRAIEAAVRAIGEPAESIEQTVANVIRAWLDALPGWRMVPVEPPATAILSAELQWPEMIKAAPSPPGLEENDEK